MSADLNAFEALALVPGWDPDSVDVEELAGGLTNRTFLVRFAGEQCVLRLNGQHAEAVTLDRSCELTVLGNAATAGLGPNVVYSDVEHGILLTEYLTDRVWVPQDLAVTENIEALGELLRRVHRLPATGLKMDLDLTASRYQEYLAKRQGLHAFATQCVEVIANISHGEQLVCCHNDVVADNIIGCEPLKFIDWEYACDNDPFFDLASVIGYHNLDQKTAQTLLSVYTGGATAGDQERLADQLRIFDAIQWLWLAIHHLNAPNHENVVRLEELQQRIK